MPPPTGGVAGQTAYAGTPPHVAPGATVSPDVLANITADEITDMKIGTGDTLTPSRRGAHNQNDIMLLIGQLSTPVAPNLATSSSAVCID
jgi:hypothetical protein